MSKDSTEFDERLVRFAEHTREELVEGDSVESELVHVEDVDIASLFPQGLDYEMLSGEGVYVSCDLTELEESPIKGFRALPDSFFEREEYVMAGTINPEREELYVFLTN